MLNNKILNLLHGKSKIYYSINKATYKGADQCDQNIYLDFPPEYLNSITENLPPHELKLKVNAIVILIRNLSIEDDICNGTRMKITKLWNYNIQAKIQTGEKKGNHVLIQRITITTNESDNIPFILYRK